MRIVFRHLIFTFYALIVILALGTGIYVWKRAVSLSSPPIEQIDEEPKTEEDDDADHEDNSPDQVSPWSLLQMALPAYYHAPAVNTDQPTVVLILTGLGVDHGWTQDLLINLKRKVTLAFHPSSTHLNDQLQKATNQGFDVLIALPTEENLATLTTILKKIPPHINLIADHGSRYILSASDLEPILMEIKNQNRLLIDPRSSMYSQIPLVCKSLNMPYCGVDLTLPLSADRAQVNEFLKKIVLHAHENGIVIATAPAIPVFVHRFLEWKDAPEQKMVTFATVSDAKAKGYFVTKTEEHQERPDDNE